MNLVEASFLKNLGALDDQPKKQQVITKYIEGIKVDYPSWNQTLDDQIQAEIGSDHFLGTAMQKCKDLFVHIKFQSRNLTWKDIKVNGRMSIGPRDAFTDNGRCCFYSPHIMMDSYDRDEPMLYHDLEGKVKLET